MYTVTRLVLGCCKHLCNDLVLYCLHREHDWFRIEMPQYLFPQNDFDDSIVDVDAVKEVCEVSLCVCFGVT